MRYLSRSAKYFNTWMKNVSSFKEHKWMNIHSFEIWIYTISITHVICVQCSTYSYVHGHHSSLSIEKKKSRTSVKNRVVDCNAVLSISIISSVYTLLWCNKKKVCLSMTCDYTYRPKTLSQKVTYSHAWGSVIEARDKRSIYILSFLFYTF